MQIFLSAKSEEQHEWTSVFLWISTLLLLVLGIWFLGMGWNFWTAIPTSWGGRLNALSNWYWGIGMIALGLGMVHLLGRKRQLKYVLDAQSLTIVLDGPFIKFKRRIPYDRIQSVQAGTLQAGWRVMGLSMPGVYLGSFTESGGKTVELATSRTKGDVVWLSIKSETDGVQRLALSPEAPSRLMEALEARLAERREHRSSLSCPHQPDNAARLFSPFGIMLSLAWFIMLAVGLLIAWMMPTLPDLVPMHFDHLGRVTRLGHKQEIWSLYALVYGVTLPLNTILSLAFKDRSVRIVLSGTTLYLSFGLALVVLGSLFSATGY